MISNFVSSLDGVVSLGVPGKSGSENSGFHRRDRALMGILRAVPRHLWAADNVFPELSNAFLALRRSLGLGPTPQNVVLSGSGRVDLSA